MRFLQYGCFSCFYLLFVSLVERKGDANLLFLLIGEDFFSTAHATMRRSWNTEKILFSISFLEVKNLPTNNHCQHRRICERRRLYIGCAYTDVLPWRESKVMYVRLIRREIFTALSSQEIHLNHSSFLLDTDRLKPDVPTASIVSVVIVHFAESKKTEIVFVNLDLPLSLSSFLANPSTMCSCLSKILILICVVLLDCCFFVMSTRLRFDKIPLKSEHDGTEKPERQRPPSFPLRSFPLDDRQKSIEVKLPSKKFKPDRPSGGLPLTNGREIFRFNHTANQNCQTFLYHQKIEHPGCKPRLIVNRGCFGFCNSFMHVVGGGSNGEGKDLKFVQTCSNDEVKYRPVRLSCHGRKKGYKLKSVLIVKSCKCRRSIPMKRRSLANDQTPPPMVTFEPDSENDWYGNLEGEYTKRRRVYSTKFNTLEKIRIT